ncbi:hypothetical protein ACLOJK_036589 [Asimina triloba]
MDKGYVKWLIHMNVYDVYTGDIFCRPMSPPPIYRGGADEFSLEILWVIWVQRGGYDPYPCLTTVVLLAAGDSGSFWWQNVIAVCMKRVLAPMDGSVYERDINPYGWLCE